MQEFKPDQQYFQALAERIVRISKVNSSEVLRVDINCGGSSCLGWVILRDGQRIKV